MTEFEGCMVGIGVAFIFIAIFKDTNRTEEYLMRERNKELRRLIVKTGKIYPPVFNPDHPGIGINPLMEGSMPKSKKKKDTSVKIPKRLRVRKEK